MEEYPDRGLRESDPPAAQLQQMVHEIQIVQTAPLDDGLTSPGSDSERSSSWRSDSFGHCGVGVGVGVGVAPPQLVSWRQTVVARRLFVRWAARD